MERKKCYDAILFRQRASSPLQVSFAAPSAEIDSWARVPTKRTGDVRNFQRAEIGKHVKEVAAFFKDPSNSSPTAIVVGFDPIRAHGRVKTLVGDKELGPSDVPPGVPTIGKLEVTWDADCDPQTREEYIAAIQENLGPLRQFVYAELIDITGITQQTLDEIARVAGEKMIDGVAPEIIDTADTLEGMGDQPEAPEPETSAESETLPEIEVSEDLRALLPGLSPSEQQVVVGRLYFLAQLSAALLQDKSPDFLKRLHNEVQDELKPGILIDGQHRVVGTKLLGSIPFVVTALPYAPWPELAFQFIVTNRTAKKVPESLLISIVGNSLSKLQRGEIEERLREAGIKVGLIEAVMRIHEDPWVPIQS